MKIKSLTLFSLLAFFLLGITSVYTQAQNVAQIEKGVVVVKFEKNMTYSLDHMKKTNTEDGNLSVGIASVDELNRKYSAKSMQRLFPPAGKYEYAHRAYGLHLWYVIKISDDAKVENAVADYTALNEVLIAEPSYLHQLEYEVTPLDPSNTQALPGGTNDPGFPDQWHYNNTGQTGGTPGADISLLEAWAVESGSNEVIVSVHDTGADFEHEDLADAMWVNEGEIPGNGIDDDGNGYIDDVYGYYFYDDSGDIQPGDHGSHTAGTIGAVTNNSIGVSGIAGGDGSANGVRIMSCAWLSPGGYGSWETGAPPSYVYAADNGAVISSNSTGSGSPASTALEDAFFYFRDRAGLDNSEENFDDNIQIGPMAGGLIVFSSGNDNSDDISQGWPSSPYDWMLEVNSTDKFDKKSSFSNYGTWTDISAPGSNVYSLVVGGYGLMSGTSMACPHVSGVAALALSRYKGEGFTPEMLRNIIISSVDNIDDVNPNYIGLLGSGRVNAALALIGDNEQAPDAITDLVVSNEDMIEIELSWTAPSDGPSAEDPEIYPASYYDIRYSTSPITAANFDNAMQADVSGFKPAEPGTNQSFTISGLNSSTAYYFAIKSGDMFGYVSNISNMATGTTEDAPVISLVGNPDATIDVNASMTATSSFIVENEGLVELDYQIFPTYLGIPGLDIIESTGMEHSFVPANTENVTLSAKASPSTGQPAIEFADLPIDVLMYDNGDEEADGTVAVTAEGTPVEWDAATKFEVPAISRDYFTLTHINTYLKAEPAATWEPNVVTIIKGGETPTEGEIISQQAFDNIAGEGMLSIALDEPVQLQTGDEFWVVFSFASVPVRLGFDEDIDEFPGTFMVYMNGAWTDIQTISGFEEDVFIVRAAEMTAEGVTLDVSEGILAPGSQQTINVTYDATNVEHDADYKFKFIALSNDPLNPVKSTTGTVTVTGIPEPEIGVEPEAIVTTIDVGAGESPKTETLTITNIGEMPLDWEIVSDGSTQNANINIPAIEDATEYNTPVSLGRAPVNTTRAAEDIEMPFTLSGSIAHGFDMYPGNDYVSFMTDNPGSYLATAAISHTVFSADFGADDETSMYFVDYDDNNLYTYNTETGVSSLVGSTKGNIDMACDKTTGVMYTVHEGTELYTIDLNDGTPTLIGTLNSGGGLMISIACDADGQLWGFDIGDDSFYAIDKETANCTLIGACGFDGNYAQGMAYSPEEDIVYMAAYNNTSQAGELRIVDRETGATTLVGTFPSGAEICGLGFPGGGSVPPGIVYEGPTSGTLEAGESTTVDIVIDVTETPNGVYESEVVIESNDFTDPVTNVPMTITVTGQPGELTAKEQALDYEMVYTNYTKDLTLNISNTGLGECTINNVSLPSAFVSDFDGPVMLMPRDKMAINVTFQPVTPGTYNGVVSISGDNFETLDVDIFAEAYDPPIFGVTPDALNVAIHVPDGKTATEMLTLSNTGGGYPLEWMAEVNYQVETNGIEVSIPASEGDFTKRNEPLSTAIDQPREGRTPAPATESTYNLEAASTAYALLSEYGDAMWTSFDVEDPGTIDNINDDPSWDGYAGDFIPSDPDHLYAVENENGDLIKVDITTGDFETIGPCNVDFTDMACDKATGIMYATDGYSLFTVDVETGDYTEIGEMDPDLLFITLACDGSGQLYSYAISDDNLYAIDKETAEITQIGNIGFDANYAQSMAYDPETDLIYVGSYGGGLDGKFRILDPETGNTTVVGDFPGGEECLILAFPGGGGSQFLALNPTSGSVAEDGTQDVEVSFDASVLKNGTHEAEVLLTTNDPVNELVSVPVTLEVSGQVGRIDVSEKMLEYQTVFIGADKEKTFDIMNIGIEYLNITDITTTNDQFSTNFDELADWWTGEIELDAEQLETITVTYTPTTEGTASGAIVIHSNDPEHPTKKVLVAGVGTLPPEIDVNPTEIEVTVNAGEMTTRDLVISNTGNYPLTFSLPEVAVTSILNSADFIPNNTDPIPELEKITEDGSREDLKKRNGKGHPVTTGAGNDSGEYGYTWIDSNEDGGPVFSWIDITTDGTLIFPPGSWQGDGEELIDLPFVFNFYGKDYEQVVIGANGALSFEEVDDSWPSIPYGNSDIPNTAEPNGLIAPFWYDLEPDDGEGVYYKAESDKLIVTWLNNPEWYGDGTTVTLQVIVYADGSIVYQYLDGTSTFSDGGTIGIEGPEGNMGMKMAYASEYIEDNLAVLISPPEFKPFDPTADPLTGVVLPGEDVSVTVTFDATDKYHGLFKHDLLISSDDPYNSQVTVPLMMEVIGEPDMLVDDSPIEFGELYTGLERTKTLTIENNGTRDLNIELNNTDDAFYFDKNIVNPVTTMSGDNVVPPVTTSATANVTLSMTENNELVVEGDFSGLAGEYTWASLFEGASDENGAVLFDLTANVNSADMASGTFAADDNTFALSQSELDLLDDGLMYINIYSSVHSDNGELRGQITTDDEYVHTYSATVKPRAGVDVDVVFAPGAAQFYLDNLALTSDDVDMPSVDIQLTGRGVAPPVISVAPMSITAEALAGGSDIQTITITNNGADDLEYSLSGAVASELISSAEQQNDVSYIEFEELTSKDQEDTRRGHPVINGFGGEFKIGNYLWIDSNEDDGPVYDWTDIETTGIDIGAGDDTYEEVELPFEFKFFDNTYTKIKICSNGYLTFGTDGTDFSNDQIPDDLDPNDIIAPFWDDLAPQNGNGIQYLAEADKFIVQYTHVPHYGFSSSTYATFQVILYPNGNILYQYKDIESYAYNDEGTIGVENEDGTDGLQVAFNTPYVENELAVLISPFTYIYPTPETGVIASGASADVELMFDASELLDGVYEAPVNIFSNDPVNSNVTVNTTFKVTGEGEVTTAETIEFDDVWVAEGLNEKGEYEFEIKNSGTKALTVNNIVSSDGTVFPVDVVEDVVLEPKQAIMLEVEFEPAELGDYTGALTITWDDTETEIIALNGSAISPPAIELSETAIDVRVPADGGTPELNLVDILNTGAAALSYTISIEKSEYTMAEKPERVQKDKVIEIGETPFNFAQTSATPRNPVERNTERDVLWDNTNINVGTSGIVSTKLGGLEPGFDIVNTADDFIIPDGKVWSVEHVYTEGFSNEANLPDAFGVTIYADNNGEPGEAVFTEELVPDNGIDVGIQEITFSEPLVLGAGYYWISVYGVYDGATGLTGNRWDWYTGTTAIEMETMLQDQTGIFGIPPGWTKLSDLGVTDAPSCFFKIEGTEMDDVNWITVSPEEGTVEGSGSGVLSITVDATQTPQGHYAADVIVNSNDPLVEPVPSIHVNLNVNTPPQLMDMHSNLQIYEGETMSMDMPGIDMDGDDITYYLPEGSVENAAFSVTYGDDHDMLNFTFAPDYEQAGLYTFQLGLEDDLDDRWYTMNVEVMDVNRAPEVIAEIPDKLYIVGDPTEIIDLTEYLIDPDGDMTYYYTASFDPSVVGSAIQEDELYLIPKAEGTTTIEVSCMDWWWEETFMYFDVEVLAKLATPTSLMANAPTLTSVELNWTDNCDAEIGYVVERSIDGLNWIEVTTTEADAVSYTDEGLESNTLYYYRVKAISERSYSPYSNVATIRTPHLMVTDQTGDTEKCIGGDVTFSVTVEGNEPITYQWRKNGEIIEGETGSSIIINPITEADAGMYSCEVSNDAGTIYSDGAALILKPINVSIAAEHVKCYGESTGKLKVIASGGYSDTYQYSLNGVDYQDANIFENLVADSYTITVKDGKGCTTEKSITVTSPDDLTAEVYSSKDITCPGGDDGFIQIEATGGVRPYTYTIGDKTQESNVFKKMIAGTYDVMVADDNGCQINVAATLEQPAEFSLELTSTDAECYGEVGTISVAISGGTPNYTCLWNNSSVVKTMTNKESGTFMLTDNINGIVADNYTVTIEDSRGCRTMAKTVVSQPDEIIIDLDVLQDEECKNGGTGMFEVEATGGAGIFEYGLNDMNFQSSGVFDELTYGTYSVTAKDASGCKKSRDVYVGYESTCEPVANFNFWHNGKEVHFINKSSNADSYQWEFGDGNMSTEEAPDYNYNFDGTYQVTLTAKNTDSGLEHSITKTIAFVTGVDDISQGAINFNAYPNPTTGKFNLEFTSSENINDMRVRIMDMNGRILKVEELTVDDKSVNLEYNLSSYDAGVYIIEVATDKGFQVKRLVIER